MPGLRRLSTATNAPAVAASIVVVTLVVWIASGFGEQHARAVQSATNADETADDTAGEQTGAGGDALVGLLELVLDPDTGDVDAARQCLAVLAQKIQSRELAGEQLAALRPRLDKLLSGVLAGKPDGPLYLDAALLASSWRNPAAVAAVRKLFATADADEKQRLAALDALVAAGGGKLDKELIATVRGTLADAKGNSAAFRGAVLQSLGRIDDPAVADAVLASYDKLEAELQPKAIELLTQRTAWAKALLAAVGEGRLPAAAINANQVRQLLAGGDAELAAAVKAKWGSIREERDPKREEVIAEMRRLIRGRPGEPAGDPHKGREVFGRVCGQCHKLYGQGADVGPDLTSNGRASFEQLLSNVFDPSLVIGAAYQAVNVRTIDGRVLTGLLVEDSSERLVLKVQGGKTETLARNDVDEVQQSKLSMMPEGLETQLSPQEIRDLFALLTLDRSPDDPEARLLPGVRLTTEDTEGTEE